MCKSLKKINLSFKFKNSPEGGFKLATIMHDTVTRLANLPLISVCLVRGRAIGGGAELTLSTDFRVFAPTGKLNFVQARLGVLPGWAGGSKLVNLTICVKQFVIICNYFFICIKQTSRIRKICHVSSIPIDFF
jgi:enoyl-CoA hydratase/carnithine racemase